MLSKSLGIWCIFVKVSVSRLTPLAQGAPTGEGINLEMRGRKLSPNLLSISRGDTAKLNEPLPQQRELHIRRCSPFPTGWLGKRWRRSAGSLGSASQWVGAGLWAGSAPREPEGWIRHGSLPAPLPSVCGFTEMLLVLEIREKSL